MELLPTKKIMVPKTGDRERINNATCSSSDIDVGPVSGTGTGSRFSDLGGADTDRSADTKPVETGMIFVV